MGCCGSKEVPIQWVEIQRPKKHAERALVAVRPPVFRADVNWKMPLLTYVRGDLLSAQRVCSDQ